MLVPKRCQDIRNGQCPRRRYGCNQWHPDHEPRPETFVDDLAELVPAGELVPILYLTLSGRAQVPIFSKPDKARYELIVEAPADVPLRQPPRERLGQGDRIDCTADAGRFVSAPRCPEHGNFLMDLVPGRPYCRLCHQRDMNVRGLANYPLPTR